MPSGTSATLLMLSTPKRCYTLPGPGIPGHVPGARPGDGARRASGGRPFPRRPVGLSPKELRGPAPDHQEAASGKFATYPSRGEGEARCLIGTLGETQNRHRRRRDVHIGAWNVTTLAGKEPELVEEAIRYRLDIVGVSSTKRKGKGTMALDHGWQLFYSGVDPSIHAQTGVGFLISPRLAEGVVEWKPVSDRAALLRLWLKGKTVTLVQVYAPNTESEYAAFLDEVLGVLQGIPATDSIMLMGDF